MFIGVARYELFIAESRSLKNKRAHLRPVLDGVRSRFNVGIAEVGLQELWQRAAIGVTCTSTTEFHCRKMLQEVEKVIGRAAVNGAEIVDRYVHVVSLEDL